MPKQTSGKEATPAETRFWSNSTTARYIGIHPKRLRRLAQAGYIRHKVEFGLYWYLQEWADEYIASSIAPNTAVAQPKKRA